MQCHCWCVCNGEGQIALRWRVSGGPRGLPWVQCHCWCVCTGGGQIALRWRVSSGPRGLPCVQGHCAWCCSGASGWLVLCERVQMTRFVVVNGRVVGPCWGWGVCCGDPAALDDLRASAKVWGVVDSGVLTWSCDRWSIDPVFKPVSARPLSPRSLRCAVHGPSVEL